jgi:uncharacterized Ntn-hydrolase superfamily protein
MTYSILARDPETGALGVGVQSHAFGVGRVVGWLEPGVGGVATQAFVNVGLGPRGLDLLRAGLPADRTVEALLTTDDMPAYRQVAVIDAQGRVASFTGERCVPAAGSRSGDQVVTQGNLLASDEVYESMVAAYASSTGDLAERILAALRAAEDAGGDARGSQSAAIKVVSGRRSDAPWEETLMDLRVEDHVDPIGELARLVALQKAHEHMGSAIGAPGLVLGEFADASQADVEAALVALEEARVALGDNLEAAFWKGVVLTRAGRGEDAAALFDEIFAMAPRMRLVLDGLGRTGFLDPAVLALG